MTRAEFIKEIEARGFTTNEAMRVWYGGDTLIAIISEWGASIEALGGEERRAFRLPYSAITVDLINAVAGEKR